MSVLVIESDNRDFLTNMQNVFLSTSIKGHTMLYEYMFGWWSDEDCKKVIEDWILEDKEKRIEIIKNLGGMDSAITELAMRANQCFDANDGINWSYLEIIRGMIVKRYEVKDRG